MNEVRFGHATVCLLSVILTCNVVFADRPIVDGIFDEWTPETLISTDPAGDATSVFDITEVYAASAGTLLYVNFDTTTVLNVQSGPTGEDTLRLEVAHQGSPALTIDFRNRTAYTDGVPANYLPWSALDFESMTTYAASRFELRADLSPVGIGIGDTITLDFSGSDSLNAPVPFTLQQPAEPVIRRDPARLTDTTFRMASLNTLSGGLLSGGRMEPIGRLVQAAAADVYCFQEQSSTSTAIADRLAELDPLGNGLAWSIHRAADTVIATQRTLVPLLHFGDAAAVIDFGSAGAVLVFSIHPRCCGYIGSSEDLSRIAEMQGIVDTIADFRSGQFGQEFEPYRDAPIIIIGDWNLVGSRTPLDMVEDPQGPALAHWLLPHLVGDDVHTWRSSYESAGSFAPGLLDLLAYSAQQLIPRNGFALDSTGLNATELQSLGLQLDDSDASDHLMLVADFMLSRDCNANGVPDASETIAGGDHNGDSVVDFDDLSALSACLAGPGLPPTAPEPECLTICLDAFDNNNDGDVDLSDLAAFQALFTGSLPS